MTTPALILFVVLTGIAVGALAYAALQPAMERARNAEQRLKQMKGGEADVAARRQARSRVQEAAKRRRTLEASLDAIETRQKEQGRLARKIPLQRRIEQAGLSIGVRSFVLLSVAVGVVATLLLLAFGLSPLLVLFGGPALGFMLPRWTIGYLRKRRVQRFVDEFANAVDVIVRGVRSGLPLNDTLRMVANEAQEPVRSEFRRVVEAQQLGMPTAEAVDRLYQNMPMAETNFFSIVVAIQSQAGGSLSEALANLSRVLRERKKMKAKVKAMSSEAKTSAGIIGSLPVIVSALMYLTAPDYITLLFVEPIGQIILLASAIWMSIGVVVMRQMIAFDF